LSAVEEKSCKLQDFKSLVDPRLLLDKKRN